MQGFTKFIPGSSYMMFVRGTSSLPLSGATSVDFIPPVDNSEDDQLILKTGISFLRRLQQVHLIFLQEPGL